MHLLTLHWNSVSVLWNCVKPQSDWKLQTQRGSCYSSQTSLGQNVALEGSLYFLGFLRATRKYTKKNGVNILLWGSSSANGEQSSQSNDWSFYFKLFFAISIENGCLDQMFTWMVLVQSRSSSHRWSSCFVRRSHCSGGATTSSCGWGWWGVLLLLCSFSLERLGSCSAA